MEGVASFATLLKESALKSLFRIAVLLIVCLNLAESVLGLPVKLPLFIASGLAFLSGFPLMSAGFRKAAAIFLGLGMALLFQGRQPLEAWMKAAGSMTNVIAIVAVMQTFALPIKLGAYDEAIRTWMRGRFRKRSSLFIFTTFTTHILTSFLNLGSLPVIVNLFGETLKDRIPEWKRFFSRAATRGYVMSALWSPGAVNLYLVVQATGLSWSRVFLPGILLALLGMALSWAFETRGEASPEAESAEPPSPPPESITRPQARGAPLAAGVGPPEAGAARGQVAHILIVAALFVLMVEILEALKLGAGSGRTILAGALVVLGWTLAQARRPGLAAALKAQWREGLLKVGDIAPFFVAMGLFSGALEGSGLMALAGPALSAGANFLGGASVLLIGGLIVAASLVGLHPFITIVLFGKLLSRAALPIPPLTLALGLSVGGAAAYMVTPFAGVIMTISKLIDAKASDVALRWNWRFSILFFATGMLYAFLWGACFG